MLLRHANGWHGLPKIHKPDWPLRPFVLFINSPLYNLSKFVAKILTTLINSNNLSIKNSFELVDRISNFKINETIGCFLSMLSLFTKIPVHIAKLVIFDRLSGSQTFCARGTLCYLSKFCGTLGPECRSFLVCTEFSTFSFS